MKTEDIADHVVVRLENDRFVNFCGIVPEEVRPGYGRASVKIRNHHLNGVGIIQGGLLFTLADYAFAMAANSRGKTAVAVEASVSFIKGVSEGILTAEAVEVSCKKTLARYDVRITNEQGEMIALYHGTAFRKD